VGSITLVTGPERKRVTSIGGGFNPSPIISNSDTDVADSIRNEYGVNAFSNFNDYKSLPQTASPYPPSGRYDGGSGVGGVYSVGGTGGGLLTGQNNGCTLFTGPSGGSEFSSKERMSML
jgi:hypothetical protein